MKSGLKLFTLSAGLLLTSAMLHSQEAEKPHLELVRAMRAKGYNDLALSYLEGLAKKGPKSIQAFIPLEKARVRMDMADRESNLATRTNLYAQARQEFLDFVKNRPADPLAAEAQFEAARIIVLEGRSLLRQGMKLDPGEQVPLVQKAADRFKQARTELEKAEQAIDAALPKADGKLKESLEKAKGMAVLERQRNLMDLAATYEPLNLSLAERGKLITGAIEGLTNIADNDRSSAGPLARAWIGKAYLDLDNPGEAKKTFDMVLKQAGPEAEEGKRMARFFQFMQGLDERKPAPAEQVQAAGEEWLKLYPNQHNTAEGMQVRYQLAHSYIRSAQALYKAPATPPVAAKTLYNKALTLFRSLESPENELSEEASGQKVKIMIALNVGSDNIQDIKEFSQAFIAAQAQAQKMADAEQKMYRLKYMKDPSPKQEAEAKDLEAKWPNDRKQYLRVIRDLLNHARSLADDKTPPGELAECYANLVYVYVALGEPEKGAVLGEYAARQMPNVSKAASAAAYALQAYSQMIGQNTGAMDDKWVKTDEDRLLRLAEYMEKTWPNETSTDSARHQVGLLLLRQRRAREAAQVLSRVSASYKPAANLTDARYWWAMAAQQMLKEPNLTDEEKKSYQEQARVALEGIPEVPTTVPSSVAQMYVLAKVQFCSALFEAKKFDELDKQAAMLQKKVAAFDLPDDVRDRLRTTVQGLATYAQYGRAQSLINADQPDKALDLCDQTIPKLTAQFQKTKDRVTQLKKEYDDLVLKDEAGILKPAEKTKMEELKLDIDELVMQQTREAHLLRGFLSVSLNAAVQSGNIARSQQLLTTLRAVADETIGVQIYVHLVKDLKDRMEELQAANKTKELNQLMTNFNGFLDALSKQKVTPEILFFIANALRQLNKPNDAAKILDRLADPGQRGAQKDIDAYRGGKLLQVELYLEAKNFDQAATLIGKIENEGWARVPIMKQKANMYQLQQKWGPATVAWKQMMETLAPHIQQPKFKEQYYQGYFNYIKCFYLYAVNYQNPKLNAQQVAEKRNEYIERVAKLIVKVEEAEPANMGCPGLKEQYDELLKSNPPLKREYDKAKAAAPAAGN